MRSIEHVIITFDTIHRVLQHVPFPEAIVGRNMDCRWLADSQPMVGRWLADGWQSIFHS